MKARMEENNPKELTHVAKVLGFSYFDMTLISFCLFITPALKVNPLLKFFVPVLIIAVNKYLNRNHPMNIYVAFIKKKKTIKWFGTVKGMKK